MPITESKDHNQPIFQAPTSTFRRVIKAYWVTFVVINSFMWHRLRCRFAAATRKPLLIEDFERKNARRIYRAILELQGLYIKVGQLISIMTNFLPETFRSELEGLQDKVPARPYDEIEKRFREEFDGRSPYDLFEHFEETPIASASIGQVHVARLTGGRTVAVKVQYPNIEKIVQSDLKALQQIIRVIQWLMNQRGLDSIYLDIRAIILMELDFTNEARNVERIAQNFVERNDVQFPKVVSELSTRHVLTTEFIQGVKVSDVKAIEEMGIDRTQLAKLVIESYCEQIFLHGIYHADPHPGNILVSKGPTIHFVDFGAVAEVSEGMRKGILALLHGAINRDTTKIIAALREMGFIAHTADPKVYDRVVEYFHNRFREEIKLESFNLKEIQFDPQKGLENIADLRRMNISLRDISDTFHVPKEWVMLERTILLLMGLCTELDPDLNPMVPIRPYVERFVLGEDGNWSRFLLDSTRDMALSAISLPSELLKFTTQAMHGDIEVSLAGMERTGSLHYALGHQLIYTAIGIATFSFGQNYAERGDHQTALYFTIAAGGFAVLLLRSFWKTRGWLKQSHNRDGYN